MVMPVDLLQAANHPVRHRKFAQTAASFQRNLQRRAP
jgi:hypothetical protein